jgi:hypothetical protein
MTGTGYQRDPYQINPILAAATFRDKALALSPSEATRPADGGLVAIAPLCANWR